MSLIKKPATDGKVAQSIEGVSENSTPEKPKERTYEYAIVGGIDNINLQLGGKTVSGKNKKVTLNQAQHDELQELISSGNRLDLMQHLRLIDREEAEKIAAEYLAAQAQRQQAHRGANSTLNRHILEEKLAENPGDRLRNMDVQEETILHAGDGPLESSKQ